jgi:lysozyme
MSIAEYITKHEGRKNKPYRCPAGARTIGVGYNDDANPLPKHIADHLRSYGSITDVMIDELLNISIEIAEGDCMRLFPDWDNFTPNRKMALTDFLFQLGYSRASKFTHAIAAINTGRWEDAAHEMRDSNWARQVPKRADEVTDLIEAG